MSQEIFAILNPFADAEISKTKEDQQDFVYYTNSDTAIKIIDNQENIRV